MQRAGYGVQPRGHPSATMRTAAYLMERGADLNLITYNAFTAQSKERAELFGRVIRGADGRVCDICEFKDASESVRAIRELNVGVYLFDSRKLFSSSRK